MTCILSSSNTVGSAKDGEMAGYEGRPELAGRPKQEKWSDYDLFSLAARFAGAGLTKGRLFFTQLLKPPPMLLTFV